LVVDTTADQLLARCVTCCLYCV